MSNTPQFSHALFIYSESSHLIIVLLLEAMWLLHYYETVLDLLCERFNELQYAETRLVICFK